MKNTAPLLASRIIYTKSVLAWKYTLSPIIPNSATVTTEALVPSRLLRLQQFAPSYIHKGSFFADQ